MGRGLCLAALAREESRGAHTRGAIIPHPSAALRTRFVSSLDMTDSPLFTEPVLVVNQKAKLIEINNEYAVFDEDGTQIGAVRQVGQSKARKVLRVLTSVDQFLTHRSRSSTRPARCSWPSPGPPSS